MLLSSLRKFSLLFFHAQIEADGGEGDDAAVESNEANKRIGCHLHCSMHVLYLLTILYHFRC